MANRFLLDPQPTLLDWDWYSAHTVIVYSFDPPPTPLKVGDNIEGRTCRRCRNARMIVRERDRRRFAFCKLCGNSESL